MNRENRPFWVLVGGVVFLVLGLAGYAISTKRAGRPLRVYYASAGGAVLFPHDGHEEIGQDCAYCHHELIDGPTETSCAHCHHAGSFDATDWSDEDMGGMHADLTGEDSATCLGCHSHNELLKPVAAASQTVCAQCHEEDLQAIGLGHSCSACHGASENGQAMACRTCHMTGEGQSPSCETCHQGSGYTHDMLAHGDLVGIEGHRCASCHIACRGSDAVHSRCNRCHHDLENGTFFTRSREDEESVCRTCHMKQ